MNPTFLDLSREEQVLFEWAQRVKLQNQVALQGGSIEHRQPSLFGSTRKDHKDN